MPAETSGPEHTSGITALLGPTNTGKTHRAVERMLRYPSGMIGLPLRLLAREVYDRVTARIGERRVALVTGEEKRIPRRPQYWICTVEAMPVDRGVDFLAVDEIQLAAHRQRGHTFTDRLLHARGREETWFLGAQTIAPLVANLVPTATIERHPRFSKLRHVGSHALTSLPPRTAVVAFSVAQVYEIAERLRRRHGGTAVVLGALSPRTRNAQVAMYQAGEVQHMVATDAIGMGLNLDIDRVAFAAVSKFDGQRSGPLDAADLAQIAGRAGRYTRDGGFGTVKPLQPLADGVIRAIETHRFPNSRRLVWRNRELDFRTLDGLVSSLRVRPPRPDLHLVEQADDFDALASLARTDEIRAIARDPTRLRLLWDVCRVPDFRKLMIGSHVQLLGAVYTQLAEGEGRIDTDWMARRITRIDDIEGDIDTLMNRIAFIRTWTYISNHRSWVRDAEHWQEVTRGIEDRLSDALHERLRARFVDHDSAPAARRRRKRRSAPTEADKTGPFRSLLDIDLPDAEREQELERDALRQRWVQEVASASHHDFVVDESGWIQYAGERLARLTPGVDPLHPQTRLGELDDVGDGGRAQIQRRLQAWVRDALDELLAPVHDGADTLGAAARGLAYALEQELGLIPRSRAAPQVRALSRRDRDQLQRRSIVVGRRWVYVGKLLREPAVRLRAALWSATAQPREAPPVPAPGAVSMPVTRGVPKGYYRWIGYPTYGPRAVRVDQAERALEQLDELARAGTFQVPPTMCGWLGCRRKDLPKVLRAMGYGPIKGGRYRRR